MKAYDVTTAWWKRFSTRCPEANEMTQELWPGNPGVVLVNPVFEGQYVHSDKRDLAKALLAKQREFEQLEGVKYMALIDGANAEDRAERENQHVAQQLAARTPDPFPVITAQQPLAVATVSAQVSADVEQPISEARMVELLEWTPLGQSVLKSEADKSRATESIVPVGVTRERFDELMQMSGIGAVRTGRLP